MSQTVRRLFKRLHEAGLMKDYAPEDFQFIRHSPSRRELEDGAIRWTLVAKEDSFAPSVSSGFTVRDCTSQPVQQVVLPYQSSDIEIAPSS